MLNPANRLNFSGGPGPASYVATRLAESERAAAILGTEPPRAAGPLRRGRLADADRLPRRQPGPGGVAHGARQAGVQHGRHAGDGDRALGDVGRQDHPAPRTATHRALLVCGRQVAVQRQQLEVVTPSERSAGLERPADLGGSGEEDQDVAAVRVGIAGRLGQQAGQRRRHPPGHVARAGARLQRVAGDVLDPHRMGAAGELQQRCLEEAGHRLGVERGAHHDQPQVRPPRAP